MFEGQICIALCDDDNTTHTDVNYLLNKYKLEKRMDLQFIEFYSAEELIKSERNYDILLLDYDMPVINGIDAAKELRRTGSDCKIIMLTGKPECYKEAFKIQAVRFITKKIVTEEFFEALSSTIDSLRGNEMIELSHEGRKVKKFQRSIDYIMANDDYLRIYIGKEIYHNNMTLKKMEGILDKRIFQKCHKSVIVNLERIKDIRDDNIYLTDGTCLKIAKRRKNEFMKAFITFDTTLR